MTVLALRRPRSRASDRCHVCDGRVPEPGPLNLVPAPVPGGVLLFCDLHAWEARPPYRSPMV